MRGKVIPVRQAHTGVSYDEQPSTDSSRAMTNDSVATQECEIVAVGKRRDGGTRFWCLRHKADATAKYGIRANACRASHIPPVKVADTFELNLEEYEGGIALWGAVPPVYDTTQLPIDRGIHVHARRTTDIDKEIDQTYRAVRLSGAGLLYEGLLVSELDAIYYMVTSVFGFEMKHVVCSYCGYLHLDRDWFSLHPHRSHLCAGCGRHFRDTERAIGNPICSVRDACGAKKQTCTQSAHKLNFRQSDYPGGIQIWGSNPAFLWTSKSSEDAGIHIHAFKGEQSKPDIDETFGEVTIDGVRLDPSMVRIYMAQTALPHILHRVRPINCPSCNEPQFGIGEFGFTPIGKYCCHSCSHEFRARGRLRTTIANPLPAILENLSRVSPRPSRRHVLDLLAETL